MLYHGTSAKRFERMQEDGFIKVAPIGVECVSTSRKREVAQYFAELAADCDQSSVIILELDPAALVAAGLELDEFSDPVWGEGECEWEEEIACWQDIPLHLARDVTQTSA